MKKQPINIVWLKRDIRSQDHEPLFKAEQSGIPYKILYIYEPSIIEYPDTSPRHLKFIYNSIQDLNTVLKPFHRCVEELYGEAITIFKYLDKEFLIKNVFSYQESGTQITWDRDKEVGLFFKQKNIVWEELQRDGIIRGIKNRKDWNTLWYLKMHSPVIQNKYSISKIAPLKHPFLIPKVIEAGWRQYPKKYQPAGEKKAWQYLKSFVDKRGVNYQRHISKPAESRLSCSRLSPYLAWGNISVKQAYQFVATHPKKKNSARAFSAMLTRLHWHCHFIQKFEVECRYETVCINQGYELLPHKENEAFIRAWKTGNTGYPLVDSCMRAVEKTGWINFRMRAMVVSFLTMNLDQDWRHGVYHLARQFLDYEPGIHYTQFQMQAGTTGVNTIRLYNPVKNSQEHDPEGVFIKKWIPELEKVPLAHIHEPWKMTLIEQTFCETIIGEDYPLPIVNLQESARLAREKNWEHKKHPAVQKEKHRILKMHVNKK
ncbi:cryptochrome/deoxyribodipyrimidine photo-lyase family protein [uncultured Maribacter sp.]|uniref:cryptochrome/deoxyribodipyrimidine photo-lyase family protein n=1 Tax=uncultured Maribacter sp. TaxID=431308 RepID=UPI00262DB9F8|nr:deoxyribodipyrimidine photo-lyase [uncultured Maribacter sp.]